MPVVRLFILFLLFITAGTAYSQTSVIEGLKSRIRHAASAKEKLDYLFMLFEEKQSMSTETHRYYVSLATGIANTTGNEYYKDVVKAERVFLMAKDQQTDSALAVVNSLLNKYEQSGNTYFISKLLDLKGRVFDRAFRRSDMINASLSRLKECERYNDTFCLLTTMNGMAWAFLELGKNEEALNWLKRAFHLQYADSTALKKYNCLYSNTALTFYRLGKQDSAEYYIGVAIRYARETETLTFLANALSFRAQILMRTPGMDLARSSLNESLTIRKQIGDPYYILYDLVELAGFYAYEKDYAKSMAMCKEGIQIAYQSGLATKLPDLYRLLADNYAATGNYEQGMATMKKLAAVTDSLNNAFTASLSDVETKYEVQKRENVIMKQQFDLMVKNYFLFGSLLLLLVVIASAYFIFRENRRRQSMKMEVMRNEEKRMALQAVADAEEAERKRIAADLHDNLGAQANAILYSTELLQQDNNGRQALVSGLHDTARDMLTSLRATLWALKNTEVAASDIWIRLINFTKQLERHYDAIKITAEGAVPVVQLSSAKALNIVFILQEAMNNAVRHSGATQVSVLSEYTATAWKLEVKDNGEGFDFNRVKEKKESYGLNNMIERATATGAMIIIETASEKGTSVALTIPNDH